MDGEGEGEGNVPYDFKWDQHRVPLEQGLLRNVIHVPKLLQELLPIEMGKKKVGKQCIWVPQGEVGDWTYIFFGNSSVLAPESINRCIAANSPRGPFFKARRR